MKNILVLAYMLSPTKGSEYSVAWNYVAHMSKNNKLTILYGVSGKHMGDCEEIESYGKENPGNNALFVPVYPDRVTNMLNWINKRGWLSYTFYFAYHRWHKLAYKKAKDLISTEKFDLIHYLGPIGYREPGYLWKFDIPYLWGPVSGAENYPWSLYANLSLTTKVKFTFRTFANILQLRFGGRIKRSIKRTDLLLTATTGNQIAFRKILGKDSVYFPENGIVSCPNLNMAKFDTIENRVNLLCVGTLEYRKNILMIFHALARVRNKKKFHLHIVGDGHLRSFLENQAIKYGLENVATFYGQLPRPKVFEMFSIAHLHIITSIGESNTTVMFEALEHGVPTLTLDHCGMHDIVKEGTGYKIPISNYDTMVNDLSDTLDHIIARPLELKEKAIAVIEDSKKYLWEERIKAWEEFYERCITNYKTKHQ